jgi:hypothetical protein
MQTGNLKIKCIDHRLIPNLKFKAEYNMCHTTSCATGVTHVSFLVI